MNKIRFSHVYDKLRGIDLSKPAVLIRIEMIDDVREVGKEFIEYDSKFHNSHGDLEFYPLKKNLKYMILYFMDDKGLLFTTIRRYTPAKLDYYQRNYNCGFEIDIKLK